MNVAALITAILFGALRPLCVDLPKDMKAAECFESETCVVAAVIPQTGAGYEEDRARLQNAADDLSRQTGKSVLLTRDLLTYLVLLRMEKRGVNAYERENLAKRMARISSCLYRSEPPLQKSS
ncbi:MAG TPA: hypothetical protein DIC18_02430 [Clostridiales bacterium]|nr:hypothetical protein [Clostridiales bacterium]